MFSKSFPKKLATRLPILIAAIFALTFSFYANVVKAQELPQLSVGIIASPNVTVTAPNTITLTAFVQNAAEGDIFYEWICDTGETSDIDTLVLSSVGVHNCEVGVMDWSESSAFANGVFTINPQPIVPEQPVQPLPPTNNGDLIPTVVLYGNVPPVTNDQGTIYVNANTPFVAFAHVNTPGNPNYTYQFTGVCNGIVTLTDTLANSNPVTLGVGQHLCGVVVTDSDGDVAAASVLVIVSNPSPRVDSAQTTNTDLETQANNQDTQEDTQSNNTTDSTTCTERAQASGFVFIDVNRNNVKENSEEGIQDIDLTIYVKDSEGKNVEVVKVKTNRIGYWESELCPGKYSIKIDSQDISSGYALGGSDNFEFDLLSSNGNNNVNFAIHSVNIAQSINWWIVLFILFVILLGAGGYAAYSTSKK